MCVLWALTIVGAPCVLGRLVWCVFQSGDPLQTTSYLEFFAGKKAITRSMRRCGRAVLSFERDDDEHSQDFCSDVGFAYALRCVLSLEDGGGFGVTFKATQAARAWLQGVQRAALLR